MLFIFIRYELTRPIKSTETSREDENMTELIPLFERQQLYSCSKSISDSSVVEGEKAPAIEDSSRYPNKPQSSRQNKYVCVRLIGSTCSSHSPLMPQSASSVESLHKCEKRGWSNSLCGSLFSQVGEQDGATPYENH